MTTISSHALHPRTAQTINVARSWSLRALQIADQALSSAPASNPDVDLACAMCYRARSVGLYNMGMLSEVSLIGLFRVSHSVSYFCVLRWFLENPSSHLISTRPVLRCVSRFGRPGLAFKRGDGERSARRSASFCVIVY
jgi:hypothetical protein